MINESIATIIRVREKYKPDRTNMAPCRREPVCASEYKWENRSAIFTLVLLVDRDLFRGMLDLKEQLYSFDRSDGRLGNSSRNTTGDEVLGEGKRIGFFSGHLFKQLRWSRSGLQQSAREATSSTKGKSEVLTYWIVRGLSSLLKKFKAGLLRGRNYFFSLPPEDLLFSI